jgi:molybdopterin converting factor small subunit
MADFESRTLHYYSVKVNDTVVSIFELQLASVAEALLAAGIRPRSFLGRPGAALVYTLNGETKIVKGEPGTNAKILVNGKSARLEHKIAPGDEIHFAPGIDGADAKIRLNNVVYLNKSKKVWYNGREEIFCPRVRLNGEWIERAEVGSDENHLSDEQQQWVQWVQSGQQDQWMNDGDTLEMFPNDTLEDFLRSKGLSLTAPNSVHVYVNNEEKVFKPRREILLNGEVVTSDRALTDGDKVDVNYEELLLRDLNLKADPMPMYLNNRKFYLDPKRTRFFSQGLEVLDKDPVNEGMVLSVQGFAEEPILSDLLPYVPDIHSIRGGSTLRLEINDREAGFTSKVQEGDRIMIEWVKS